jgi:hypothetical protein
MLMRPTVLLLLLLVASWANAAEAMRPRIAFVTLSCAYDCSFTFGKPNAVVGTVSVTVAPSTARFSGTISLAGPSIPNSFRLVGNCATGSCTLTTVGAPNTTMDHPVDYHVNLVANDPALTNSPTVSPYKVTGIPVGWTGPRW